MVGNTCHAWYWCPMPLNLYRRHHRAPGKCIGGHAPDSRNYEPEELRRNWKRCHCPIYVCGTLDGIFQRKNTKQINWADAKRLCAEIEARGTWEEKPPSPPEAPLQPVTVELSPETVSVQMVADAYLASRAARKIAASTLRKYATFLTQLRRFAASKGYVNIDQFTMADMDAFYATWRDGVRAKGKKLSRLKGLFKFAVKRKWITENPASELEAPIGSGTAANRVPFTDGELTRIYDACDRLPAIEWKNHLGAGTWTGEDAKSMIMLLCWTGLRISDGATFDMSRVTPHPGGGANIFLRMHKTKGALFTWVDDWLYERLLVRERKFGAKIFAVGGSERLETVTDLWRRRINRVFALAGIFECGTPTPHIFRHTFVRLLLQRGVSPRDVADLIGDTEEVVLKHYARWVPERQERLTNILREKLATAPKPKFTVISAKR